jgi:ABC-type transport system involved in cytochrome bd biosynthesis fused ATPase/permease subunit
VSGPWGELGRWLLRARPPRARLAGALGAATLAALTGLALAVGAPYLLLYSAGVHRVVSGGTLALVLVVIELLAFARSPLRFVERLSAHDLGLRSVTAWRRWLVVTVGAWPWRRWSGAASGDLLERALADTDVLQDLWLRAVVPVVASTLSLLVGDLLVLALGGAIHALAATAALVGTQVLAIGAALVQLPRLVSAERDLRAARAARGAERVALQQVAPELALLERDGVLRARLAEASGRVERRERVRDRRAAQLGALSALAPVLSVLVVARVADAGATPSGRAGLVVLLLAAALAEALAVTRQGVRVAAGVTAAAERLDALAEPQRHGHSGWPAHTLLDVESLCYRTDAGDVLDGLSLTVAPGRRLAITGANGAGKSTLLRLLARLDEPDQGAVSVGGVDLAAVDEAVLRRHLAYVSAAPGLLSGLADRVVRAGRLTTDDPVVALGELGLNVSGNARLEHLSRGEAQRAALARGLLDEPDVILLDEPTSGLGPSERDLVLARLARSTATIIVATHDPVVIDWCDERAELSAGRLRATR